MLVLLFFSAITIGFIFKKSKIVTFYIMLVAFLLSAYKFDTADMVGYIRQYNQIASGSLKMHQLKYPGYYIFQSIFANLRFSQQAYFNAFYIVCLVLIYLTAKRLTKNINVVLSVFMVYPFAIEAIQMKQFLADSLTAYALTFVFDVISERRRQPSFLLKVSSSRVKIIIGTGLLVFATLIQFDVVFFFAVAVYLIVIDRENIQKYNIVATVIGTFLIYMGFVQRIVGLINRYARIVDLDYISGFLSRKVGLGITIPATCICLILIIRWISTREIAFYSLHYPYCEEAWDFITTIIFVIAVMGFGFVYFRLFRVYFIIMCCMLSNSKLYKNIYSFIKNVAYIAVMAILFVVEIYWYYDTTLGVILHNNYIFNR